MTTTGESLDKKTTYHGNISTVLLFVIFVMLNFLATYQLDFWQNYFYGDSEHLSTPCSLQQASSNTAQWDQNLILNQPLTSVVVPHPQNPLLKDPAAAFAFARYLCRFKVTQTNSYEGAVILHMGWVFGSKISIYANGLERSVLNGNDRIMIPLNQDDLARPDIEVAIHVISDQTSYGIKGYAPAVIAFGNQTNAKITGAETALQQVRYLYSILPALTLGLMFGVGWYTGLRSTLMTALFHYLTMITLRNLVLLLVDIWPWPAISSYLGVRAFYQASFAAFCLLMMEFLGVGKRYVMGLTLGNILVTIILFPVLLYAPFNFSLQNAMDKINLSVFPIIILGISYLSYPNLKVLSRPRRLVGLTFITVACVFAILSILDFILYYFGVSVMISNKIDIAMPVFIGGVVLYALSLIQQEFLSEKAMRQKFERDLEVAREIQDSLAPPLEIQHMGPYEIRCIHEKHDAVAGDWLSLRQYHKGQLLALIADATGKGVQAALVIHALQSLWAEHLDEIFEKPEQWIKGVNNTLTILGERKAHSMTMGLCLISPGLLTYYSAGHLPLYLFNPDGETTKVTALAARGGILGVNKNLQLSPKTLELPDGRFELLMASDGVLPKGSKTAPRDLLALRDRLLGGTLDVNQHCDAEDDKTLIHIQTKIL